MAGLFEVKRTGREMDNAIAKRSNSQAKKTVATVKSGNSLLSKISQIQAMVEKNLGQFAEESILIQTTQDLHSYFDKAIQNKVIAIDTETTGLNPLLDKIVGLCIYTPNEKTAYVPINHISYITNERVDNQLTESEVAVEMTYLLAHSPEIEMFNAGFDIRVIRNQLKVKGIYCTWDASLAGRLLNENEEHKNLKHLHNKYCLDGKGDAFRFDDLFKGISFDLIPIKTGYLYAAHDSIITHELCEYQRKYLREDSKREDMRRLYWVFKNIEMPCVDVVADMEDTGVAFDFNKHAELSPKYHKMLEDALSDCYTELDKYSDKINEYRAKNINNKLSDPINIGSPTQLAILLYDIIKVESVDKKSPRGTGADILEKLDLPICKKILDYRTLDKLVGTYIDKLPECVESDNRIHCRFNQYGADTGRMSSSNPNLQNIPSHNKEIRQMFKATIGEELIPEVDNHFEVDKWCEVKSQNGWISSYNVVVGDKLEVDDTTMITVTKIEPVDKNHILLYY